MTKNPLKESGQTIERSRTNIFIMDDELWNWAKFQSKERHFSSVSEYLFQLIRIEQETNRFEVKLLLELEKYFELTHFTLGDVANETGLSIEYINKFVIKRKIPLNNHQKAIPIIHSTLLEQRIAPREMCILNRLNELLKYKQNFPEKRELLIMFYEKSSERRNEVFATAFNILDFITSALKNFRQKLNLTETFSLPNYSRKDLPIVLFESGIDPGKEDDLFDNPFYQMLVDLKAEDYFLLAFDLAGYSIIYRDLAQITVFQAKNLEHIAGVLVKKIQELFMQILQFFTNKVQNEPSPIKKDFLNLLMPNSKKTF